VRTETPVAAAAEQRQTKKAPLFPFLNLQEQLRGIRDEIMAAIQRVLESQQFILGPEVNALEQELAATLNAQFAIGCASGSDALLLALMALEIGPGDEVITPPFTFVATAGSIARLGATPVFIDIDPDTFNLDPAKLAAAITSRTRAIMPVHLFGLSADMDPILKIAEQRGIPVIEDAAQAIGARYHERMIGTMGRMGCFSFFPSKNLGGYGDGGLITTNDAELAAKLKLLRAHGSRTKYDYDIIGVNSRLDALQAAILRVKLRYLDSWTEQRRSHAADYNRLFQEHGLSARVHTPSSPAECHHVYNQYTIRVEKRDELKQFLADRGIPSEIYYPSPLHLQPAFTYLGHKPGDFTASEQVCNQVLSLPVYPELSRSQQALVVQTIAEFYEP
jgi:dTDP-4-amino-4,6-dideoxygalactose transaminase